MGNKPILFSAKAMNELFYVPASIYPDFVTIKYSSFCPYFWMGRWKYDQGAFSQFDIPYEEVHNTSAEATRLMRGLWGRVALFDIITVVLFWETIWPLLIVSILLSVFVHIASGIAMFVLYIMFIGFYLLCTWYRVPKYMRKAHFCLALFLWAENNWYYIRHNCLLWPGYNGRWIEFIFEGHNVKKKVKVKKEKLDNKVVREDSEQN